MLDSFNVNLLDSLSDEERLTAYDKQIINLHEQISKINNDPYLYRGYWSPETLRNNLKALELKRKLLFERMSVGIVNKPLKVIKSNTRVANNSDKVFIAIQFTKSLDPSIKAIEEGITDAELKPLCLRNKVFTEPIMIKALECIRSSCFVIVDLTNRSNSVSFEAGFAYGLGIPCIFVYKKNTEKNHESLEFYSRQHQCHAYERPEDLKEIIRNALLELK